MFFFRGLQIDKRRSEGFNLTEIAIILGIIGIVLGAIWAAVGYVAKSNELRLTTQQLEAIVNNMHGIYAEQGGVADTGNGALVQAVDQLRAFPLEMRQAQSTASGIIFHVWYPKTYNSLGSVVMGADDCTGAANTTGTLEPCFDVKFIGVPQGACTLIVERSSQLGLGLQRILINGAVVGDISGTPKPLPIPASTASEACATTGGTITGTEDVLWVYAVKGSGS